jgi:hypothetical protein
VVTITQGALPELDRLLDGMCHRLEAPVLHIHSPIHLHQGDDCKLRHQWLDNEDAEHQPHDWAKHPDFDQDGDQADVIDH